MKYLGQEFAGRRCFFETYSPGCLRKAPFKKIKFDCGLFIGKNADREIAEKCIYELVGKNNDWICTYGVEAEYWHDRIDLASVDIGRQEKVGDGNPMTAWFGEITLLEDIDPTKIFGGYHCLLLNVSNDHPEQRIIAKLCGRVKDS
jgi:hypothetical protein